MFISLPAALAGASSLLAAYVAISLSGFFRMARWRQHRIFIFIALSGSAYCLLDVATTTALPIAEHLLIGRLKLIVAGVHVALWMRYAAAELGPVRWQRWAEVVPIAAGVLCGAPRLSSTNSLRVLPMPSLGVNIYTIQSTRFGSLLELVIVCCLAWTVARYLRAALRGTADALLHGFALSLLMLGGLNDVLSAQGVLRTPHLVDAGFCATICVIAGALNRRWCSDIRALDELTATLESKVSERAQALEYASKELARSDRLAAVGRLAGGMAHEINNPGAALIANLEYLLAGLTIKEGGAGSVGVELPDDAAAALEESLIAARRISGTVRQLLLVARAASADEGTASFALAPVVRQAAQAVARAHGDRVPLRTSVPENIVLGGRGLLLEQILVQLLGNAMLSISASRTDGCVQLTATCEDGVMVLQVIDNGVGMEDAVTQRLFEPFFSTRPAGEGAGLGLAVSLGLLQALGGEVRVQSAPGKGTIMTLVLEAKVDTALPVDPLATDAGQSAA